MPDLTPDFFERHGCNVSRETCELFGVYKKLLLKWQKTINLVSETTLEDLENRHFLDSAQLFKHLPRGPVKLADMGSGAGFPGLVLAMMGAGEIHLIESDVRKATFLREVSRETSVSVTVHDDRVEDVQIEGLNVITARALAPLKDLLSMARRLAGGNDVKCLFLKGEKYQEEIEKAKKRFDFTLEIHDSLSDSTGKILVITGVTPR
ncbi:MAG: 16S rRNA (guanine(527)-N(7))-methyltransferase RsmG [Alphaproteobacteria bacterium]|nr:16S rRNA (guanine(527)-N(7))-methyltransferase RsmG [Alphaproteobacteria bacterium]MDE2337100.1 16S rRNA (guanine(527)-N(7))-methyltransferase RsmG [Alphaproteobacteria bacterium]